jgi:hypothetical protein
MPVYHFRLTDTETGAFRNVSVSANSKDEAEATILLQEAKKVNYQASPDEVKDLESKLKSGTLSGRDKARLLAHRQEKPYTVKKATGGDD